MSVRITTRWSRSYDVPSVLLKQLDSEPLESWKLKVLLVWCLKLIIADIDGHKKAHIEPDMEVRMEAE